MGGKKHVTSACTHCRRRKIKCDGKDICSNCATAKLTCIYNAEADMRKVSAKKVITELRTRLTQLEDTLRQQGLQQHIGSFGDECQHLLNMYDAKSSAQDETITVDVLNQRPLGDATAAHESSTTQPQQQAPSSGPVSEQTESRDPLCSISTIIDNSYGGSAANRSSEGSVGESPSDCQAQLIFDRNRPSASPFERNNFVQPHTMEITTSGTIADNMAAPTSRGNGNSPGRHESLFNDVDDFANEGDDFDHTIPGTDARRNDKGGEDSIENLLAARMGSLRIAEDGQLRYYGPTSNLHVQANGCHSLGQSMIRDVSSEGADVLRRLGLDHVVPLEVEAHLAKLYFTWEDPAIHVVDEDVFFQEKHQWATSDYRSPYYSETLNNAICAIGASLAANEDLSLPEPASEFFSARAKALLEIEMDSPTVATVQALVVMSASEAAFTRDARGWLYSGMAARLSADLGLQLDVEKHRNSGLLSQRDLEIRRTAFWGVFIHENTWSLYMGRPRGTGIRSITTARPDSRLDAVRGKMWRPYPLSARQRQSPVPDEGLFFPLQACTDGNIAICEFMFEINTTLYSDRKLQIESLVSFLTKTKRAMFAWYNSIHASLKIDLSNQSRTYVPAVIQLHMQFYAVLVSLYRPYLSTEFQQLRNLLRSPEDRTVLRDAKRECVSAAHQTVEYLRCYQRQHTLARLNIQIVHIVFTVSLVFTYDVCTGSHHESRSSLRDLQFCCHALGEIGQCYGNATRALEVVILVKSEWQRLVMTQQARNSATKRRSVSISRNGNGIFGEGGGVGDEERSKRRSRLSFVEPKGRRMTLNGFTPASSSAFQTLCDNYVEPSSYAMVDPLEDAMFDDGMFPGSTEYNMDELGVGSADWLDGEQFASIINSDNGPNIT